MQNNRENTTPSVSVIIPVYNVVAYLKAAIHSALAQNIPGMEIIVVNDGSDPEASDQIVRICAANKTIQLIHQNNMGPAAARANGVKQARGEYIVFLDADDVLLKDGVSRLIEALQCSPSAIAAYGKKRMVRIGKDGLILGDYVMPTEEMIASGDILVALLECTPLLSNGNICVRRKCIEKVVFPEELRQGEDWVTWCRLALLGDIIYVPGEPVVYIRLHEENTSNKSLNDPSALFAARDFVFNDEAFIARLGQERLSQIRKKHTRYLHMHFLVSYRDRKQPIRMWLHKAWWHIWDIFFPETLTQKNGKVRVLHVVKWFHAGGAERLLSAALKHSDKDRYEHVVLSLSDKNERLKNIRNTLGIPYYSIDIPRDQNNVLHYLKTFFFIKGTNPDVIKTWLPPSNITGGIIARLLRLPLIWGIHDASEQLFSQTRKQRFLSRFLPWKIVCCSSAVYNACKNLGYEPSLLETITNGTDTEVFRFTQEGRGRIRKELGISDNAILIGMAAEYIPTKRHKNFLVAAKIFTSSHPDTHFLFCGRETAASNASLNAYLKMLELEQQVHLLGIRDDMADIYSALDIHTLHSDCESFGLATTEAMACETLCVATDVGIMRELLYDIGEVIPVSDNPNLLADAWKRLLGLTENEKLALRKKGRKRIEEEYSIIPTAKKYDETYNYAYTALKQGRKK